jgi:hypothetical protein
MLMQKPPQAPVPAETLFPMWRGRQDFRPRLAEAEAGLHARFPGLAQTIAEAPFARLIAAEGPRAPVFKYNRLPEPALAVVDGVPHELRAAWLCALCLHHMGEFDAAFAASGLPGEFALHYADAFLRICDQIEADPGFADARSDAFLKDLWLTRVVMIPAFAQLWWPHSGIALAPLLRAGPVPALRILLGCGGRAPMLEGHTHDPVAKAYWNEPGWGEALRLAALALPALPWAKGVFGSAWFYDPAILTLSPRVAFAQTLQYGRGAWRVRVGSNPDAIANATATSPTRREAMEQGSYLPTDWMMIWSRGNLIRAYG